MNLRKGKTKNILDSSIDSALLAVEVFNKPRTPFRVENYIILMIMAWTRLFHAFFNMTIGDKYYYKKGTKYTKVDGEKKAWELKECIKKYNLLSDPEKKNLEFFIQLRNRIEHRHIERETIGVQIFGECQSLLYNYEKQLINIFGPEYAINENLAFSLQFSTLRTKAQIEAQKNLLSSDAQEIVEFINKFRMTLSDDVFNSQEFSIKLMQIPKISNTDRGDLAIEFVNWNNLDSNDRENILKLTAIIKNKIQKVDCVNVGKLKPSTVVEEVKSQGVQGFNLSIHTMLWKIFKIRPNADSDNPFETESSFSTYDEVHKDYVYSDEWVGFIVNIFSTNKLTFENVKRLYKSEKLLNYREYLN